MKHDTDRVISMTVLFSINEKKEYKHSTKY